MLCGSERLHTLTNQVAEHLTVMDVALSRQEIERRIAEVAADRVRRPVLVLKITLSLQGGPIVYIIEPQGVAE
jgi:hypothetical protein